jgi:hypothetical protein
MPRALGFGTFTSSAALISNDEQAGAGACAHATVAIAAMARVIATRVTLPPFARARVWDAAGQRKAVGSVRHRPLHRVAHQHFDGCSGGFKPESDLPADRCEQGRTIRIDARLR